MVREKQIHSGKYTMADFVLATYYTNQIEEYMKWSKIWVHFVYSWDPAVCNLKTVVDVKTRNFYFSYTMTKIIIHNIAHKTV